MKNTGYRSSNTDCQNTGQRRGITEQRAESREVEWNQAKRRQRRGDNIAGRLRKLAIGVLQVTAQLPETPAGKHVSRQLLRAGTSGGANYEEARSAESRADFIHKVAVAVKEVRETQYWLLIIRDANLLSDPALEQYIDESDEIISILTKSRKTAGAKAP